MGPCRPLWLVFEVSRPPLPVSKLTPVVAPPPHDHISQADLLRTALAVPHHE